MFTGNAPKPVVSTNGFAEAPVNIGGCCCKAIGFAKGFECIIKDWCWAMAAIWTDGGELIWFDAAKGSAIMNGLGGTPWCCCCCCCCCSCRLYAASSYKLSNMSLSNPPPWHSIKKKLRSLVPVMNQKFYAKMSFWLIIPLKKQKEEAVGVINYI